ncbi:MAG: hypothetical protein NC122_05070 [Faecalibacterium sp.]|nr:hypothetical protein [Ruminococcus sp.]MCM1391867.1 hypothetical protein [Ruminococcus sp.]MCM1485557.1 hypothetical protein [Faecalibacterium sp.]
MIDIEAKVYNNVVQAIKAKYPDVNFCGEYVESPAEFPCVCLVEDDNYTFAQTLDESLSENHTVVMYTVNVYSSKKDTKKSQAKAIAQAVDEQMQNMKFRRLMFNQIPNVDRTIYRIVMQYTAIVGKGEKDGENIIYQIYR